MRDAFAIALTLAILGGPLQGQRAREWQFQATATVGEEHFLGGGVGLALRTGGRMRAALVTNVGAMEGEPAFRPEVLAFFHLNPFKRSGVAPYVGGGVTAVFCAGGTREYIVAVGGLEWRPGAPTGWFAEVGVGGGVRLAAGIQLRRRLRR